MTYKKRKGENTTIKKQRGKYPSVEYAITNVL